MLQTPHRDEAPRVKDVSCAVLVVSCRAYLDRMIACQDTWVADLAAYYEIPTIFVVGNPDLEVPYEFDGLHNLLKVRAQDGYHQLSAKVQEAYRWVLEETSLDFIFKCDDDTFINPDLFAEYGIFASYIGVPMAYEDDDSLEYASGGCGYFLSRSALQIVVEDIRMPSSRFEDVAVGIALRDKGILMQSIFSRGEVKPIERIQVDNMNLVSGESLWNCHTHHLHRESARAMYHTYDMYKRRRARFNSPSIPQQG